MLCVVTRSPRERGLAVANYCLGGVALMAPLCQPWEVGYLLLKKYWVVRGCVLHSIPQALLHTTQATKLLLSRLARQAAPLCVKRAVKRSARLETFAAVRDGLHDAVGESLLAGGPCTSML
jgi:hypothetical protein